MSIILFLNDIGGSEIIVIVLVALMFFGSKSIPGIAKTLGQASRAVRDAQNTVQNEIRKGGEAMKSDFNLDKIIRETEEDIVQPFERATHDISTGLTFEPPRNEFVSPVTDEDVKVVGELKEGDDKSKSAIPNSIPNGKVTAQNLDDSVSE